MKTIKRSIVILISVFFIKILLSCNKDDDLCGNTGPYFYDLNIMKISGVKSNGQSTIKSDTMSKASLAFGFCISDSLRNIECPSASVFSFSSAYACKPAFRPRQSIKGIKVITLQSISDSVPAGTEVTTNFLASLSFGNNKVPLNNFEPWMSGSDIYFYAYYNGEVKNDRAQFLVSTQLSDGRILSDTTSLIHLVN